MKEEANPIKNKSSLNNTRKPRSSEKEKRDIKGWSLRPKQKSGIVELPIQLTPLWCIALSYKRIMTTTLQLLLPVFLVTR